MAAVTHMNCGDRHRVKAKNTVLIHFYSKVTDLSVFIKNLCMHLHGEGNLGILYICVTVYMDVCRSSVSDSYPQQSPGGRISSNF